MRLGGPLKTFLTLRRRDKSLARTGIKSRFLGPQSNLYILSTLTPFPYVYSNV